jgi:hypothetical protein
VRGISISLCLSTWWNSLKTILHASRQRIEFRLTYKATNKLELARLVNQPNYSRICDPDLSLWTERKT